MKELLEFILARLASKPEEIKIDEVNNGNNCNITVHLAKEDFGAVIGRGGKVANSIRTVVRTYAKTQNKRVNISFE